MDYTTNLNLKKPNGEVDGDFVLVEDLNSNFDAIDTAVGDHIADTVIHITETERTNYITNFASSVRATVLTGLSTATNAAISATDTVLSALGKLQKQITDHFADAVKHITATERTNWGAAYTHSSSTSNPHSTTKAQVGLGSVDNTADTAKPVSTAQQTALNLKIDKSVLTAAGDIIYATAAATPAKLAKGTDGHVLTLASGLPIWVAPGAKVVTGTYTGDYTASRFINLGFNPSIVIINRDNLFFTVSTLIGCFRVGGSSVSTLGPLVSVGGFYVSGNAYGETNETGAVFNYVAIG